MPQRSILTQHDALVGDPGSFDVAAGHGERIPAARVAQVESVGLVPGGGVAADSSRATSAPHLQLYQCA